MKHKETIQIPAGDLRPAVTALSKIVKRQPSTDPKANVLVQPINRRTVRLTGTDLEFFFAVEMTPIGVISDDPFTIPLAELQSRLKGASSKELITLTPGPRLSDELPKLPKFQATPVHLDPETGEAIHKALLCSSNDPTRYALNGVLIDKTSTRDGCIVGTDGRHLYLRDDFDLPELKESIILPSHKVMNSPLVRVPSPWTLRVSSSQPSGGKLFRLEAENWSLTGPIVEGNYPNYRQVIPESTGQETRVVLPDNDIPGLVTLLKGLPKKDPPAVGLRIDQSEISLLIRKSENDAFEEIVIPGRVDSRKAFTVFVSPVLLGKALRFGLTHLEVEDESSPVTLQHGHEIMVVMPMRVNDEVRVKPSRNGYPRKRVTHPDPQSAVMAKTSRPEPGKQPKPKERKPVPAPDDPLKEAMVHLAGVKDSLKSANSGLSDVLASLRQANQQQRINEKEIRQVRSTIRTLKKIRL